MALGLKRQWAAGRFWRVVALLAMASLLPDAPGALAATPVQTAEVSYGGADDAAPASPRHGRVFGRGLKFKAPELYRKFERTAPTRGLRLPPAADLSALFPPPKDQGDQSSCVGWSVGYAMRGYYANRAGGRSGDREPILLSPSFVYNQIADPEEGCDGGSDIADALTLLRDVGTVPLSRFPYRDSDCKRRPAPEVKREAGVWRIQSWKTVDLSTPNAIKEMIARGDPVVIGMYVNDAFTELVGPAVFRDTGHDGGGHAMVVVGYDDNKRAFRLINSWGREWGENGFGWISYDSFKARTDEAYVASVAGLPPVANSSIPTAPARPPESPQVAPSSDTPPDTPDEPEEDTKPPVGPASQVDAIPPGLSSKGQKAFQDYLAARAHKAFALGADGSYGWRSGRTDGDEAVEQATAACERHAEQGCRVVSVDGHPVGGKPTGPVIAPDKRKNDDPDRPDSGKRTKPITVPAIQESDDDE